MARGTTQVEPVRATAEGLGEPEFKSLVDGANVAILCVDDGERIVYCNSAAEQLFGFAKGKLLGQCFRALLAERLREGSCREIAEVRRSGNGVQKGNMLLVGTKCDGREFTAEMSVSAWSGGVNIILRDITQWLETEQTMAALLTEKEAAHEESETLRAASVLLSQNLKFEAVLDAILESLQRMVPYDCASILTIEEGDRLVLQSRRQESSDKDESPGEAQEKILEISKYPLLERVVRGRESVVVGDAEKHPSASAIWATPRTSSWVGIPLIATDRVIGICCIEKEVPEYFTPVHVHRAESLMRQASIAIQNSRLFDQVERYSVELEQKVTEYSHAQRLLAETNSKLSSSLAELERRNLEVNRLSEFTDMLQACQEPEEVYRVWEAFGPRIFGEQQGTLWMLDSSKLALEMVAGWGASDQSDPVFAPDACWALRRSRPHLTDAGDTKLRCPHLLKGPAAMTLCVPIMAHGEALGLLSLAQPVRATVVGDPPKLADSEVRVATAMTEQIALSLANLKLRETLRTQSIRDPLTGLFNRRYMEETLARELLRVARKKVPLGVMMIDIDHFKKFNDTHGHEAGDLLLRQVARTLQVSVRGEDIVCRYGGEEFTIIMPESPLEMTRTRAESLCKIVHSLHPEYRGKPLGSISISVGVSGLPEHGNTAEAIFRVADAALYQAKSEGRNRVIVGPLPQSR